MHAPSEEITDYSKHSFYEELEQIVNRLPKYHTKLLLADFNAKRGRENIFNPTIGNDSLHDESNINGFRILTFDTSRNLAVKSTMFPNLNIRKYIWTSPDGKTHKQIDLTLTVRRWHLSVLDVLSFRGAYCDTDHYLVVAKVMEDWK